MSCKDLHRQFRKSWSTDNSVSEKHFHPTEGKRISQLARQKKWVTKETATYHLTAPTYCYSKTQLSNYYTGSYPESFKSILPAKASFWNNSGLLSSEIWRWTTCYQLVLPINMFQKSTVFNLTSLTHVKIYIILLISALYTYVLVRSHSPHHISHTFKITPFLIQAKTQRHNFPPHWSADLGIGKMNVSEIRWQRNKTVFLVHIQYTASFYVNK